MPGVVKTMKIDTGRVTATVRQCMVDQQTRVALANPVDASMAFGSPQLDQLLVVEYTLGLYCQKDFPKWDR